MSTLTCSGARQARSPTTPPTTPPNRRKSKLMLYSFRHKPRRRDMIYTRTGLPGQIGPARPENSIKLLVCKYPSNLRREKGPERIETRKYGEERQGGHDITKGIRTSVTTNEHVHLTESSIHQEEGNRKICTPKTS